MACKTVAGAVCAVIDAVCPPPQSSEIGLNFLLVEAPHSRGIGNSVGRWLCFWFFTEAASKYYMSNKT
jgi:hypothetical protein